ATLSRADAERIAMRDAGVSNATIMETSLVAVPTPGRGARAAYEVILGADVNGAAPVAYSTYVDARDGSVLVRENLIDSANDNPHWKVFPNTPATDYSSTDTRQIWCFTADPGCQEVVGTTASPLAWDVNPANRAPSDTTDGNSAIAVHNWFNNN